MNEVTYFEMLETQTDEFIPISIKEMTDEQLEEYEQDCKAGQMSDEELCRVQEELDL